MALEEKITDAVERGYAFTVVTGPTKSGKSVLCRRVLGDRNLVAIEGGQIRSEADFWSHMGYQLNVASAATKGRADTSTTTAAAEGGGGVPGIFQAKGGGSQSEARQTTSSLTYNNVTVIAAISRLLETQSVLMVDDFHYIDKDSQKAIIRALKGAVFKGLPVFLLAVPHRAFDPLIVESEVEGRFKHVPMPQWALDDLLQIPGSGFPALNVQVERSLQRRICEDSFGNPLLVQEICSEFCLKNKVREAQSTPLTLDAKLLEPTYKEMAESKGLPTYSKLRAGPTGRRARQVRRMRYGGEENIFTAVLASVARLGPKSNSSLDDIRTSLREVLAADASIPQRAEIISGLVNMSNVARERIQGDPPLEWIEGDSTLVITDPFLLFYLKWSFRNQ
ncbi:MAG TPA: hypothetical protein VGF92_04850 [Stellaceae bacterium]